MKPFKCSSTTSTTSATLASSDASRGDVDVTVRRKKTPKLTAVRPSDSNLLSLLTNSSLSENIASHLSFRDLKSLSAVSRDCCRGIRGTKFFQENAVVFLSKDIGTVGIKKLKNSTYPWGGVIIDVAVPIRVISGLRHVLSSAEFVAFVGGANVEQLEEAGVAKGMEQVLSCTSKVSHLRFDVKLLDRNICSVFVAKVRSNVKSLKRLDILEWDEELKCFKNDSESFHKVVGNRRNENDGKFEKNLNQLSGVCVQLETLEILKLIGNSESKELELAKCIAPFIVNNKATLKDLSIHLSAWHLDVKSQVLQRLPAINRLAVSIGVNDQSALAHFLSTHRTPLNLLDVSVAGNLSVILLSAIRKVSVNLTSLRIEAKELPESTSDWDFLGGMKNLKNFGASVPSPKHPDSLGVGFAFLSCLPKNQLSSLTLESHREIPFWNALGDDFQWKTELLKNFKCLRKLRLIRCYNSIDDALMQWILKEFTKLQYFEFTHCSTLTDAGLIGKAKDSYGNETDSGISLKSLRGLTSLTIRHCPAVSHEALMTKLPNLRTLEYLSITPVSKPFVTQLANQNENLETIAVYWPTPNISRAMSDLLKEKNIRFKRLEKSAWNDEKWEEDAIEEIFTSADSDDEQDGRAVRGLGEEILFHLLSRSFRF